MGKAKYRCKYNFPYRFLKMQSWSAGIFRKTGSNLCNTSKSTWKVSIFGRLFITFLVIMIPIYAIGLGIYYWGFGAIHKEITSSMLSKEKFILDKLESEVQKLKVLQGNCLKDRNVVNLVNISEIMSDDEKNQAFLNIENKLNAIYLSSSLIKDITLYLPTLQKQYSILKDGTLYLNESMYTSLISFHTESDLEFIFQEEGIYLIDMYPSKFLLKSQGLLQDGPQCLLGIEFSKNELVNTFKELNTYKGGGFLLLNTATGYAVKSGTDNEIQELILSSANNTNRESESYTGTVEAGGMKYITLHTSSKYLGLSILRYIPEDEVYRQLDFYRSLLWIFLVASIIIIVIYSLSTYNFIQIPLGRLIKSFKEVGKGDLKISIEHMHKDEFTYLYQKFNEMVSRIDYLINQTYKQKILLQRSELKQYQTQINPHFLFNSFFILERMIKTRDYDNSLEFVEHLGNYFQFVTRNASDSITLEKEVFHARTYSEIQAVRFGDRIQISFDDIPDQYAGLKVPRLIIQPLIENAIVHGLKDKEDQGLIVLSFVASEKQLDILVEDNGAGIDDGKLKELNENLDIQETEMESTAVINIHNRIRMSYEPGSGLVISRNEMGGLTAKIILMLQE